MKRLNTRGFGAIEALLALVVLAIIGGASFYVYQANKSTDKSLDNMGNSEVSKQNKETESSKSKPEDITLKWYEYKSFSGLFSMKIPDGWQLHGSQGLGGLAGLCNEEPSCVTYKEGVPGTIIPSNGGRGGPFRFNLFEGEASVARNFFHRGAEAGAIKSGSNTVEKRVYEQTATPEGPDLPKGGKEYSYLLVKGDKGIYISYSIFSPNEKDEVKYVDAAVSTLKFLN